MPRNTSRIAVSQFLGANDDNPVNIQDQQASILQNAYRKRRLLARRAGQELLADASLAVSDRAAQFTGTQKLASASGADFVPASGTPLFVSAWFCFDSLVFSDWIMLIQTRGATASQDAWFIQMDKINEKLVMGYWNGSAYKSLETITLTTNKWYFATFAWANAGLLPVMEIRLWDTAGFISDWNIAGDGPMSPSSPQPLQIGAGPAGASAGTLGISGRMDKVGIWNTLLGAPDQTTLWNGGLGMRSDQVAAAGLNTGLVDYYDLDEATGATTWVSASGTRNLTASGTVTSVPQAGSF